MIETERKFLVKSEVFRKEAQSAVRIVQGFLNTHPERTVRVRIKGDKGFITVKGKSNQSGLSRFEWEKAISVTDAEALLGLCEKGVIEKIRHEIKTEKHLIEVDEFLGDNAGLIIAEIELTSEDEDFYRPDWLGKEVTGDIRYYNSQLSRRPYKDWDMD
ncbi:CYTH domain-containing protein [Sinomicrobium sp.]